MTPIDLFRVTMSPNAGPALTELFTPDEHGRIYVGEGKRVRLFEQVFVTVTGLHAEPLSMVEDQQRPDMPGYGGVNSCSAALDLSLRMAGVGAGDEVLCSPVTCSATSGSVVNLGAKIVWVDVDPITGNMDPASVLRMIGPKTKAIIAVDWGGRPCDYTALRAAASYHHPDGIGWRLPIIQDAAHRLYVGESRGDYVCWSYGPIKALSAGGYGAGMLVPPEQRTRARLLRWHGLDRLSGSDFRCSQDIQPGPNGAAGFRYHLTDDMATVLLCNLPLAINAVARARENAAWYCRALANVPGVQVLPYDPQCDYWIYTILVDDRASFSAFLGERGIATSQVHARNDRHTAFKRMTARSDRLVGVDAFDAHQVAIPVGHWVGPEDRQRIIDAIWEWSGSKVTTISHSWTDYHERTTVR